LSEVQPVAEVVAADITSTSEDKPTADDDKVETISDCKTSDDGEQSTQDKVHSDVSEQCSQMVSTKSRGGGRSYQESRRSKKMSGEKSKSVSKSETAREVVDSHGFNEQRGKGLGVSPNM